VDVEQRSERPQGVGHATGQATNPIDLIPSELGNRMVRACMVEKPALHGVVAIFFGGNPLEIAEPVSPTDRPGWLAADLLGRRACPLQVEIDQPLGFAAPERKSTIGNSTAGRKPFPQEGFAAHGPYIRREIILTCTAYGRESTAQRGRFFAAPEPLVS